MGSWLRPSSVPAAHPHRGAPLTSGGHPAPSWLHPGRSAPQPSLAHVLAPSQLGPPALTSACPGPISARRLLWPRVLHASFPFLLPPPASAHSCTQPRWSLGCPMDTGRCRPLLSASPSLAEGSPAGHWSPWFLCCHHWQGTSDRPLAVTSKASSLCFPLTTAAHVPPPQTADQRAPAGGSLGPRWSPRRTGGSLESAARGPRPAAAWGSPGDHRRPRGQVRAPACQTQPYPLAQFCVLHPAWPSPSQGDGEKTRPPPTVVMEVPMGRGHTETQPGPPWLGLRVQA